MGRHPWCFIARIARHKSVEIQRNLSLLCQSDVLKSKIGFISGCNGLNSFLSKKRKQPFRIGPPQFVDKKGLHIETMDLELIKSGVLCLHHVLMLSHLVSVVNIGNLLQVPEFTFGEGQGFLGEVQYLYAQQVPLIREN